MYSYSYWEILGDIIANCESYGSYCRSYVYRLCIGIWLLARLVQKIIIILSSYLVRLSPIVNHLISVLTNPMALVPLSYNGSNQLSAI